MSTLIFNICAPDNGAQVLDHLTDNLKRGAIMSSKYFYPTLEQCEEMSNNSEGWCFVCGDIVEGVEPDAERYTCECCEKRSVWGADNIVLMGLIA